MRLLALVPTLAILLLGAQHLTGLGANPALLQATLRTLRLAAACTAFALPLGALAAIGLWRAPRVIRRLVLGLAIVTLLAPTHLIAQALPNHPATLLAANATGSACIVLLILTSRLNTLDPALLQSAATLGAAKLRAWRLAMLPNLATPLAIAAAAAFTWNTTLSAPGHPTLASLAHAAAASGQPDACMLLLLCLAAAPFGIVAAVGLAKASKAFFFEKKKQKTFANAVAP